MIEKILDVLFLLSIGYFLYSEASVQYFGIAVVVYCVCKYILGFVLAYYEDKK